MVIAASILPGSETTKAIQVELSLEARQLRLPKVFGHDCGDKLLGLVNDKAPAVRLPRDDVIQPLLGHFGEHVVELVGERNSDSTSGASTNLLLGLFIVTGHHVSDSCGGGRSRCSSCSVFATVSSMVVIVVVDSSFFIHLWVAIVFVGGNLARWIIIFMLDAPSTEILAKEHYSVCLCWRSL
jgi:hypothetical protein